MQETCKETAASAALWLNPQAVGNRSLADNTNIHSEGIKNDEKNHI